MKRIISVILSIVTVLCMTACGDAGQSTDKLNTSENIEQNETQEPYIVSAETAEITGQGIDEEGQKADTVYDSELKQVIYFGSSGRITYTVPEIKQGQYDVYLNMGKTAMSGGSTMIGFAVNEDEVYAVPTVIAAFAEDGSDRYSQGLFLMKKDIGLKKQFGNMSREK